jgi:hypothetical protein
MRHDDGGGAATANFALEQAQYVGSSLRVEIAGGLVCEKQAWAVYQCPCDRDTLHFAAG